MEKLLEQSHLAIYWLGFIFADGWFDFNRHLIGIQVSETDQNHLQAYCSFVSSSLYKESSVRSGFNATVGMVRTTKQDTETFNKLVNIYGIQPKKTYNPPTCLISILEQMSDDMFFSFMIGFFDGDGSLVSVPTQNSLTMRFQNHVSWEFLLAYFEQRIYKIFPYKKRVPLTKKLTTKHGNETAVLVFARYALVNDILLKTQSLNLPVLTRKWKKVGEFFQYRQDSFQMNNEKTKRNKQWLDTEIELLMQLPPHVSVNDIQKIYFPKRTVHSVRGKIQALLRDNNV